MKRVLGLIAIGFILTVLPSQSNPPQNLTISLPIQQWENIAQVIEESNASHLKVKAAQEALIPELQKQIRILEAQTKPKSDSTTKPKKATKDTTAKH